MIESVHTFDIVDTGNMAFGGSIPCNHYERLHTSWLNFYHNTITESRASLLERKIIQPFILNPKQAGGIPPTGWFFPLLC